jgi:site-specific recombinase XerD
MDENAEQGELGGDVLEREAQTLAAAFDYFCAHSNLTTSTLRMYGRAVRLFYQFLETSELAQPLSIAGPEAAQRSLAELGARRQDVNLLVWFSSYLGREVKSEKPRGPHSTDRAQLAPATVRLYGQALLTWFAFLADELLLPARFPTAAAIARARRRLRTYVPLTEARDTAPEPPPGIETLIHAYDAPDIPPDLPFKERHRRELERMRNKAVLYALADSGARVSEVLQLTAEHVRHAEVNAQGIWAVQVRGKGQGAVGRQVTLRFTAPTLQALQEYLEARQDPGATVVFVSHAKTRPQCWGQPWSANGVWRLLRRTARDLGLPPIHPHDFRHWRATQMLRAGVPLDQVQRFLNHRSIRTTQLYAKTAEHEVDAAGAQTSPL